MEIITDIEKLTEPAVAYEFITETGIDTQEGQRVIEDLKQTLADYPGLTAVAAPQIGSNLRIFCVRFADTIKAFVNPVVTRKKGQTLFPETCASLPGKEYIIGRPEELTAVYYTEDFKYEENKFLGKAAGTFDQMTQLLDGILPNTMGLESDITEDGSWLEATDEELRTAQEYYKNEFLPRLKEIYETSISSDPEKQKEYKQYLATEQIINDRVQVIDPEATQQVINQARAKNKQKQYDTKMRFKAFAGKRHK